MNNLSKKIEMAANVAIIVVAALLCAALVRMYLYPSASNQQQPTAAASRNQVKVGDSVSLPEVSWNGSGKTLLFVLSNTCHFCTDSAPFYQRIARDHSDTRLVALLPQKVEEGREYLKKLGLEVNDVRQVSFSDLNVRGTPTLILVDGGGKVTDVWVGALKPDKEEEVISRLRGERASN